jgi:hypothetical protein
MRTPATAITTLSEGDWARRLPVVVIARVAPDTIDDATNWRLVMELLMELPRLFVLVINIGAAQVECPLPATAIQALLLYLGPGVLECNSAIKDRTSWF